MNSNTTGMNAPLKISLLIIIISYPLIIMISFIVYSLHQPNAIVTYNTQSLAAVASEYSWWIIGWLTLGVVYLQTLILVYYEMKSRNMDSIINYEQKKIGFLKYEKIIICVTLTIFYFHNLYGLHSLTSQNSSQYSAFKHGSQSLTDITINHIQFWPGWRYYESNNYYDQTRNRVEQNSGKLMPLEDFEAILQALKNINDGIYSTKSWLANHRLYYSLLFLAHKSVGFLFLLFFWFFGIICSKCQQKSTRRAKCFSFMYFCLMWFLILPFLILSQIVQSLITLNNHSICLPKPNSGNLNIIINKNSVSLIQNLHLNLIQDPYQIYANVCTLMQFFYQKTVEMDKHLVKTILGATWLFFMWTIIIGICNLTLVIVIPEINQKRIDKIISNNEKLKRRNVDNKNKNYNGYHQVLQSEQQ